MAVVWRVEFDCAARTAKARRRSRALRAGLSAHTHRRQRRPVPAGAAADRRPSGFWRYPVGDYRIVAVIEDARFVVLVVTVGHRRDVYR